MDATLTRCPMRTERRRGFQPPFYTVTVYTCPSCQRETTLRNRPGVGGFACSCGQVIGFDGSCRIGRTIPAQGVAS